MSNNNKKVSRTNPIKKSSSSGAGKVSKDPRFSSISNYDFRYRPTIGNNSSQRQKFDARSLANAMMGGAVSGAVAGAAFYGAGKLFGVASQAIKSARNGSKGVGNSFGSGYNGAEYDDFIRRGVTGRATVNQFNPRLNMNLGFFGKNINHPNGRFENAAYHGKVSNSVKSKSPINGQLALDNSLSISTNTTRRVGISNGEFVVLDETRNGIFHGHVRSWNELTHQMQNKLRKSGLVNAKGKILE